MSYSTELLTGLDRPDYYRSKIAHCEQDALASEKDFKLLYTKKADILLTWAKCYEELHRLGEYKKPIDTICATIVSRLKELDCVSGINYAYVSLPIKYKNKERSDLISLGISNKSEELQNVENKSIFASENFSSKNYINLPHEIISPAIAPPEDLQENEEYLARMERDIKHRRNEIVESMRNRNIARIGQKESEVIRTPTPYDPKHGHFYKAMIECADKVRDYSETLRDSVKNIEAFPPKNEKEDKELAEGIKVWTWLFSVLDEHHRPYADRKFSQSYINWWNTQVLNRDYGKHAAAVMSKVESLSGQARAMTREQVGDQTVSLYNKLLRFEGSTNIINKAMKLFIKDMPKWRREDGFDSAVAERKINVSPRLSEAAFGSDRS
jgi:hypothetical protein